MKHEAPKTQEEVEAQLKVALKADDDLIKNIQVGEKLKHPFLSQLWFFLTAWRPATKYENVRLQQGLVKLGCALINLHKHQSVLIAEINNHSLMLRGQVMAQGMEEDIKKDADVAFA